MKRVCIVIVTWNNKDEVLANLESLKELTYPNIYIVVVDNASIDGTSEAIKETYPDVTLLRTKENLGGSGGFNVGLRYTLEKKDAEYVWMLDSDVIVDKNALTALVEILNSDPETGVVGSRIYIQDKKNIIQEQGANLSFPNEAVVPQLAGVYDDDIPTHTTNVDYVAACSMLVRRECLEKEGIMDEQFFLYWDDMDLCTRIKRSGYAVKATGESCVWHRFKGVSASTTLSDYYFLRNKCYFFEQHSSIKGLILSSFISLIAFWQDTYYWLWLPRTDLVPSRFIALFHYLCGTRNKVLSIKKVGARGNMASFNPGTKALIILAARPYALLDNYNSLIDRYPDTKFIVCLNKNTHKIFKDHKLIDSELIAYPYKNFCVNSETQPFRDMLREKGFDSVSIYCSNSFFGNVVKFALDLGTKKVYRLSFDNVKELDGSFRWKIVILYLLTYLSTFATYPIFLGKRLIVKIFGNKYPPKTRC